MLEVKNLCATIAGKEILKGINLTIKDGELHAIIFLPASQAVPVRHIFFIEKSPCKRQAFDV